MHIPTTYHDGNPEDRAYARDFWSWLAEQPQQAWLYYARAANWDVADSIFLAMVRDPRCDRALASWLFWSSNPADLIKQGKRPNSDTLVGAILDRCEQGGLADAGLHYARVEVALQAFWTADALAQQDGPPPFAIPHALCASFEGRNPDLPLYDEETERELEELFHCLDGKLPRSDQETMEDNRRGGNWWYEKALRLPAAPRVSPDMSDVAAIDAVFGEHRSSLARIEKARAEARSARRAPPPETNRFGMTTDPKQRAMGLAWLGLSAFLLLGLLVAKLL